MVTKCRAVVLVAFIGVACSSAEPDPQLEPVPPIEPAPQLAAAGSACSSDGDCASAFCVGGVCCQTACAGIKGTNFACVGGTCTIASCATGVADCDGTAANGCEVDTTNDPLHCGGCAAACPALGHASVSCSSSRCEIASCATGFQNCDATLANGCEVALDAVPNCGACGNSCVEVGPNDCTRDGCAGSPIGTCTHYDWGNCAATGKVGACNLAAGCRHDVDQDGLPDEWENNKGIDLDCDGTVEAAEKIFDNLDPLNPHGANPSTLVKDVYLQYDYMMLPDQGTACTLTPIAGYPGFSTDCDFDQYCISGVCRGHSDAPDPAAITMVQAKLWEHGINLHVDPVHHQLTSHTRVLSYGPPVAGCAADDAGILATPRRAADFYAYKNNPAFFDKAKRQGAFHYVIFAHDYACDSTTNCMSNFCATAGNPDFRASGNSEYIGDDMIIAFGGRYDQTGGLAPPTLINQAATILHELGHNLGLDHGGPYDGSAERQLNYKPNFISVMNYAYQLQGITTADRPNRTNCTSDHTDSGTIVPCPVRIDFQDTVPVPLDPTGLLHDLDEHANMLNEPNGVNTGNNDVVYWYHPGRHAGPGTGPIDFDFNGDGAIEAPIASSTEINSDASTDLLQSHRDWTALDFDFQCNGLTNGDGAAPPEARAREVSWETAAQDGLLYPLLTENIELRPAGAGMLRVAVFGSMDFDASQVKVSTVSVGGVAPAASGVSDVNGDGRADFLADFRMAGTSFTAPNRSWTITGQLNSTQRFQGTAPITIGPPTCHALLTR